MAPSSTARSRRSTAPTAWRRRSTPPPLEHEGYTFTWWIEDRCVIVRAPWGESLPAQVGESDAEGLAVMLARELLAKRKR